ncbi:MULTISPECIES: nitroreductase family protein [Pseudomonas]|uniref:Nitroreductase family protein n=1 Tax=Pseudomonas quercus TaxID=2722792 RepID=A0ABX0YFN5_9PSED|nr:MULTISPECIES: nitroreductase family protein [Pseudomonas]MBF7143567.1 nitroreductase family protein [Pseudomonas sp. LY10J]NJP02233.1 nitroreductase family protein [Pseudomonas quercus]
MPDTPRVADHAIDPQFLDRWSPRAFNPEPIAEDTLLSFFEAARWAPSAYNSQPWRFLYARRDTPDWERYLGLLNEFNRNWAQHASALVIIASKTTFTAPGATEEGPALWHTFDTGSAWAYFALQASLSGYYTHGMAGFDQAKTRAELKVPEGYDLHAAVAVGKLGDKSSLPEYLQGREVPSPRRPVSELAKGGDFAFD